MKVTIQDDYGNYIFKNDDFEIEECDFAEALEEETRYCEICEKYVKSDHFAKNDHLDICQYCAEKTDDIYS